MDRLLVHQIADKVSEAVEEVGAGPVNDLESSSERPKIGVFGVRSGISNDRATAKMSQGNRRLVDSPHDIPCEEPAKRIFAALAGALGQPFGTDQ